MLQRVSRLAVAVVLCMQSRCLAAEDTALANLFAEPPAGARILKIIHSWPDGPKAQDQLIGALKEQGFGGVVCNVSFTEYLQSEPRWNSFIRAVDEAKKAGFCLWLYDEKGYPSATAGGLVLKGHPEWQARGLLIAETNSSGGGVTLQLPPGELKLALAERVTEGVGGAARTNLSSSVQDRTIVWTAPPGQWRVTAITESILHAGTHADMSLADHIPYPNLLDPAPTARFLELTHSAYARHLTNGLGACFTSTFTDEPSLMSLFLRPMPYKVLPWSSQLPAEFRRRRGNELEPLLPALIAEAGSETARARYDYWRTVGELVSENFFGQIQRWCSTNGLASGGHLLMEENLVNQVPLYGDFFACLRRLDAPSIDCLTSIPEQVPWFIGRAAASAAELEGKNIVMCETSNHSQRYRPAGDKRPVVTVSKAQVRGTCNRLMLAGVNTITSYYTFAGLSDSDLRELNEWVGRCCVLLAKSRPAADTVVLYPTESLWPRFIPARHLANAAPEASRIESVFHTVSEGLYASGRDFLYVDSRALNEAQLTGGELVLGKQHWRTVILPAADTLPLATWQKLARFVRAGGTLVSMTLPPANTDQEFPSPAVQEIGRELFGTARAQSRVEPIERGRAVFIAPGQEALLPAFLERLLPRELTASPARSPLRFARRAMGGKVLHFVINDSNEAWQGQLRFAEEAAVEEWEPASGSRREIGAGPVSAAFAPYDARFYLSDAPSNGTARAEGTLPSLALSGLPHKTPLIARGEFVRETLEAENAQANQGWQFNGAITKSEVDTFLFGRFEPSTAWDLKSRDFLAVTTGVPSGQSTATQLLVILHEKNGADYLASTGRWLNGAGEEKTILPWSRFQLAGWSTDPDGQLNLDQVTEIRIGWGGYFGTAGENVRFTLSGLDVGSVD